MRSMTLLVLCAFLQYSTLARGQEAEIFEVETYETHPDIDSTWQNATIEVDSMGLTIKNAVSDSVLVHATKTELHTEVDFTEQQVDTVCLIINEEYLDYAAEVLYGLAVNMNTSSLGFTEREAVVASGLSHFLSKLSKSRFPRIALVLSAIAVYAAPAVVATNLALDLSLNSNIEITKTRVRIKQEEAGRFNRAIERMTGKQSTVLVEDNERVETADRVSTLTFYILKAVRINQP